jgi:hypothetical protein
MTKEYVAELLDLDWKTIGEISFDLISHDGAEHAPDALRVKRKFYIFVSWEHERPQYREARIGKTREVRASSTVAEG